MKYFVYIHTCPNGKKYVGITTRKNPECRWCEGRGYIYNEHFYSAILKYGWDNITHEVFEVESKEEMYRKEIELISFYHTNDPEFGYNNSSGGEAGGQGCKHSEEWKENHSRALKGRPRSEETRRKISEALKGKSYGEERRRNISLGQKGKVLSEETRRKISEAKKGKKRGPHSEETKRKISEAKRRKNNER